MTYRSRLTTKAGDCICRQAVRLAGLRPSLAPAPAFREGVNVLLTRTEEIQKVHAHVFAGFGEAEKNQVFFDTFRGGKTDNRTAELGKGFDRVLGVVVVPKNVVVVQKRKKLITVLLESLLDPQCGFALPCCILKRLVELLDLSPMLSEKVVF